MSENVVTCKNVSKINDFLFFNDIYLVISTIFLNTHGLNKRRARNLQNTFFIHKYSSLLKTELFLCFFSFRMYFTQIHAFLFSPENLLLN